MKWFNSLQSHEQTASAGRRVSIVAREKNSIDIISRRDMRHIRYVLGVCSVVIGMFCLTLPVQAEMYVAGQVGANIPQDLTNVEYSGVGLITGGSDLSLQNSLMYGAKAGYYFDSLTWQNFNLGVETEVFNSTPHVKQQAATVGIGGIQTTIPELTNRVLTWAPVIVVVRYQAGAFEPYAGVGLGVFFSRISEGTDSSSSTDIGLNTQLGLRYRVNPNLSLFGEWKYNYANINHNNLLGSGVELSANYNANIFAAGVGYHF
jgi:opacity protein-like surface antigen